MFTTNLSTFNVFIGKLRNASIWLLGNKHELNDSGKAETDREVKKWKDEDERGMNEDVCMACKYTKSVMVLYQLINTSSQTRSLFNGIMVSN